MIDYATENVLPPFVLDQSRKLPTKLAPLTMEGRYVRLVLLDLVRDAAPLFAASNGSAIVLGGRNLDAYDSNLKIWQYMFSGPFAGVEGLVDFLRPQVESENGLCFCVFDRATEKQIGVANYMNNFPMHLKIELGNIWYSPIAQRTNANLETTYLMLKPAFALGYRRIEWKCDALNERSRKAALRMGFKFEGIQEFHFIVKDRNRDTAWFRILDREWESVKADLERLLKGD